MMNHKPRLLLLLCLLSSLSVAARPDSTYTDTLRVDLYYRQGLSSFDRSFRDNGTRLDEFHKKLLEIQAEKGVRYHSVKLVSGCSPEGNTAKQKELADARARYITPYVRAILGNARSQLKVNSLGIDWDGLALAVSCSSLPSREQVYKIITETPEWISRNGTVVDGRKARLIRHNDGASWRFLERTTFADLRRVRIEVVYIRKKTPQEPAPDTSRIKPAPAPALRLDTLIHIAVRTDSTSAAPAAAQTLNLSVSIYLNAPQNTPSADFQAAVQAAWAALGNLKAPSSKIRRRYRPVYDSVPAGRFCMSVRSNLLYDAALIPNIGTEFHLGRNWSIGANWMYAWWHSDRQHFYWRTYGGDLYLRKWFGRQARKKPLTGHHIGLYGQALTYDVETGHRGYLSKLSYGGGIEYGYSVPVGRRLNLDFSLGVGYLGGEYDEYDPIDQCYVWQRTRSRHWFGPTKAEISLVWHIGTYNYNWMKRNKR